MVRIMLFCAVGMSTSILVSKMKAAAEAMGRDDIEIFAVSTTEYPDLLSKVNVCLLGPQVKYLLRKAQKQGEEFGTVVDVIDPQDYAFGNGEHALQHALALMEKQ